MAIPFSQSMRSIQADRGVSSIIGLAIAMVLLVVWSAWFFWAPITRYTSGTIVGITRDGRIVAQFPAETLDYVWQGQAAHIRPQGAISEQVGVIPAVVANILGPPKQEYFQVSFTIQGNSIQWDLISVAMQDKDLAGEVDIEVESVSPATLVARATGQLGEMPSISFSPQQSQ